MTPDAQDLMPTNQLVIFTTDDGQLKVDVLFRDETVWLTMDQMAALFGKAKSTISEHIHNVFAEGELEQNMVVRQFRTTTPHGAIEQLEENSGFPNFQQPVADLNADGLFVAKSFTIGTRNSWKGSLIKELKEMGL